MPAIPGVKPKVRGLCVAPQGVEEGSGFQLEKSRFGLVAGEKVLFRMFSSTERGGDKAGDILMDAEKMLQETASVVVDLSSHEHENGAMLPVFINSEINDVG